MIIVEGPDGAGKTTLIEFLSRALGLPVAPRVVSKEAKALVDLKQWVEDNVDKGFQNLIFDRHRLISEPIYGPVLRSDPEPGFDDPEWFGWMLTQFYRTNPIIIYCVPPFGTVWKNVLEGDDNRIFHGSPQNMRLIWSAYFNKALTEWSLRKKTYFYDYTQDDAHDTRHLILKSIQSQLKGNA